MPVAAAATRSVSLADRTLGLARALHPFPSLLVSAVVLALVPLADSSAPAAIWVRLGAGMLCYQFAIGLTNDLVDAGNDAVAKPHKPIASGLVPRPVARVLAVALCLAGIGITFALPLAAWLIGIGGLACGLVYDLWLKRTPWSWLPLAIALPLVPLWVWTANEQWTLYLGWVLPLGMLLGFSLHLANQAPDVAADRALGVFGTAQRIGERSGSLAVGLFIVTAAAASAIVLPRSASAAMLIAVIGVAAAAAGRFAPASLGPDRLFGLLAVGAGGIAVVFLAAA